MTRSFLDLYLDPRDTAALSLDRDDQLAEIVRAYDAIRSPHDGVQERLRREFLDLQSEAAQDAIDADRAGRRAALLGTLEANRRPATAHAAD